MTLPPTTYPYGPDYASALAKIRSQRGMLGVLVLLCLLTQVVLWLLIKYDVLAEGIVGVGTPADFRVETLGSAGYALHYVFGATTFLATVFSGMLVVVLVIQALLLLQDRRTGVAATVSAAFWALLLTFLVLPWQVFVQSAVYRAGDFAVPGATMLLSEVLAYGLEPRSDGILQVILHWGRFLVYPLFAMLLAAVVLIKSGKPTKVAAIEAEADEEARNEDYDSATV